MTTAQEFVTTSIPRDRWKRPLVVPPSGGKPVAYTRCTTFVGGIEDMFKLGQWQQRHVAIGLAMRPDLMAAVGSSDLSDKGALNDLCDAAKEAAGASDSARIGTYLHAITEAADRGADPSAVPVPELAVPRRREEFLPDLAAYTEATAGLKSVHIEEFSVLDQLRIGGTPDRIVKLNGKKYIADLKTGSVDLGHLKIAAQLAVYARSYLYDWRAGVALGSSATIEQAKALRTPTGVEVDRGIVIHLPQGTGQCTLYWVDLLAGWEAVRVSRDIREKRTVKFRDVFSTFTGEDSAPVAPVMPTPIPQPTHEVPAGPDLPALIGKASSAEAIRELWYAHQAYWTAAHTELANTRIASFA
jgi:hypothetical protein